MELNVNNYEQITTEGERVVVVTISNSYIFYKNILSIIMLQAPVILHSTRSIDFLKVISDIFFIAAEIK